MRKHFAIIATLFTIHFSATAQDLGTVVGAVVGAATGHSLTKGNVGGTAIGAVAGAEIGYGLTRRQMPQVPTYQVIQSQPVATYMPTVPIDDCDEQYYKGVYDPDLARAYCQGHRQAVWRERQTARRAAYEAGIRGY